tara:strand:+ start:3192 stop:4910 length:1719 start_codon:yes stop_codon:yes gene_type:complete
MAEIVVKDKKDDNVEKALDIVNAQQKIVGKALVGASGATLVEKSEESYELLEHIRQLSKRSLTSLKSIADSLVNMFRFDKDEARRRKDQASELAKEKDFVGPPLPSNEDVSTNDDSNRGGGGGGALAFLAGFLSRIPGVGAMKKLFKPIMGFFGKSGVLFKIFGRFGPLAGLTLAVGFLIRYIDDIAKALAPVLDGLKALYTTLEPLLKAIMAVIDVTVKLGLNALAAGLKVAMGGLVMAAQTFMASLKFISDLIVGLFTGDFDLIKKAFSDVLKAFDDIGNKFLGVLKDAFVGLINGIGNIFGFDNLIETARVYFMETIPNAFNEAIENLKVEFMKDINFIKTRFGEIFDAIGETFTSTVESVKNFFVSLPGKIMSGVKSLFQPVMDFFSSIGTSIKEAINGIIDALPMPQFLKDKVKFDIPVKEEEVAKEISTETPDNVIDVMPKPKVKDGVIVNDSNEPIVYAKFNAAKSAAKLANLKDNEGDFEARALNTGGFVVASNKDSLTPNVEIAAKPRLRPNEIGSTNNNMAPIIITRGGDNSTISNVAKVDNNNVNLNVNVDSYHDRMSVAT